MDIRDPSLRCELCGGTDFDTVYLPGTAQAIGLSACRQCRLVYLPRPCAPAGRCVAPQAPDLGRYGASPDPARR